MLQERRNPALKACVVLPSRLKFLPALPTETMKAERLAAAAESEGSQSG
jgi:hypothetical protein